MYWACMHVCFAVSSTCPTHSLITPDLTWWANTSGTMRACAASKTQWEQVLLCDTYGTIWGRTETTCFWDQTGSFHIFLPPGYFLLLPLEAAGIILLTKNQLLFLKPSIGKLVWGNNSSLRTFNKCTRAKMDRFGYLFLSRVEQKLPVEPLESLPSSFPLLSPPCTLCQSSAQVDEECIFFEW